MTEIPDPRITWAVEHLHQRLHEPIAIATLAARVNLSPSRFRHLFTLQTGVGPAQYLQRLRLRRARLLIERTFLSVKEVMGLAGYSEPNFSGGLPPRPRPLAEPPPRRRRAHPPPRAPGLSKPPPGAPANDLSSRSWRCALNVEKWLRGGA